ncbi:MAG: hypothetical protein CMP91_09580 [Gammaproteobacteria bacterium]|nr:hypothetical protein [Gammaproteobacteria bacterium]MAY02624.1 hypothetical protein [Gammaproteobacteria bacterium]|tara:strand:+ start:292 stop:543 length:252 start_codon:yes stop_codon:yes gene_type:complete
MRELTLEEMEYVGGGYGLEDITSLATQTGIVGSIVGYAITGTTAGAAHGGWWGAGIGFAAGAGWAAGTLIYNYGFRSLILNGY